MPLVDWGRSGINSQRCRDKAQPRRSLPFTCLSGCAQACCRTDRAKSNLTPLPGEMSKNVADEQRGLVNWDIVHLPLESQHFPSILSWNALCSLSWERFLMSEESEVALLRFFKSLARRRR